jgi:hypothetical protein
LPSTTPKPSSDSSTEDVSSGENHKVLSPASPRIWQIEALFEITTTAQVFTNEFDSSPEGFALTIADRLKWATDVPLSRFAFWLPDRTQPAVDKVLFCESNQNQGLMNAVSARFSTPNNMTFVCTRQTHTMNATGGVSFLQAAETLTFEVGVYPATELHGDTKPAVTVVEEIVRDATGSDEPERKLLPTGLWTYKAGGGVKFHGLFPATLAAMPGAAFQEPRDTSLPLGPNPGGHGAKPRPPPPPTAKEEEKQEVEYFDTVDVVVKKAKDINDSVKNSLEELKNSLARASAVHSAWMNTNVYQLPSDDDYQ